MSLRHELVLKAVARQWLAAGQGEMDLGLDDSPEAGGPLRITLARAATAGLALAGALAICALALPGLIHRGDIRYALGTGTAAGWNSWLTLYTAMLLTTLAAATTGLTLIATKRATLTTQQPQGPYLYAATLTAITLPHRFR